MYRTASVLHIGMYFGFVLLHKYQVFIEYENIQIFGKTQ